MTVGRQALSRVPCRYFNSSKGCYRGEECWFLHDIPSPETSSNTSTGVTDQLSSPHSETSSSSPAELRTESTHICGICFETPNRYGLLASCSHIFCLFCIRKWRNREGKSEEALFEEMHKTCPVCRKHSDFIISSNTFYEHSTPQKQAEIQKYFSRLSTIPCRYFNKSPTNARTCPFGNECHYAHNVDGRRYIFTAADLMRMRIYRANRQIQRIMEILALQGILVSE